MQNKRLVCTMCKSGAMGALHDENDAERVKNVVKKDYVVVQRALGGFS